VGGRPTTRKKHVAAIAEALKDRRRADPRHRPRPRGRGDQLAPQGSADASAARSRRTPVSRVTFNAITKAAVTEAMQNPREIDAPLVEAYLARRALDYLVGFNLSPVLWRKLPGARSAGRVQSVCLRLIVEREMEIEAFNPREYWSVKGALRDAARAELRGPPGDRSGRQEARQVRHRQRHAGRTGRAAVAKRALTWPASRPSPPPATRRRPS
jgi:DNA topoisomerase-1